MGSEDARAKRGASHLRKAIRHLEEALEKVKRGDRVGARYSSSDAVHQIQKADVALVETVMDKKEVTRGR
jgi:hypothetical protein